MYDFVVRCTACFCTACPVLEYIVHSPPARSAHLARHAQADDRELVQRLKRFQEELLHSARQAAAPKSPQRLRSDGSTASALDGGAPSARPSGDGASPVVRPAEPNWAAKPQSDEHEASTEVHRGQRKPMSAASLAAALELTDLESAQQRFGGGAFLPILPLGSDTDSIDRGLPTLPDSTLRASISC